MRFYCLQTRVYHAINYFKISRLHRTFSTVHPPNSVTAAGAGAGTINNSSTGGEEECSNSKQEIERKSATSNFWFSPTFDGTPEIKTEILESMLLYADFISVEEERSIMTEIEPYLSRLHYESSHWDDAIHEYRETERSHWNKKNTKIIDRIRSTAFPPGVPQLKLVHILDLAKKGVIKPHIDSIRFCGNTIAGLSLLSDCIMRLRHDNRKELYCDIMLPKYSLYVMKNCARYMFTHEILGESESIFNSNKVQRDRRISIVCRNEPEQDPEDPFREITVE